MRPKPVTTPSPITRSSSGMSSVGRARTNASSSVNEPSSSSRSIRSRAVSLPLACCCSMRCLPPPSEAFARTSVSLSVVFTGAEDRPLDRLARYSLCPEGMQEMQASEVTGQFLGGLDYPITKAQMLGKARQASRAAPVQQALAKLPDREYANAQDVTASARDEEQQRGRPRQRGRQQHAAERPAAIAPHRLVGHREQDAGVRADEQSEDRADGTPYEAGSAAENPGDRTRRPEPSHV